MSRTSSASPLRRLFAAGMAAMILALSLAAVCPSLHEWLHQTDGAAAEDHCAVALFSSSADIPVDALALPAPLAVRQARNSAATAEIFLTSPRYLHQPECGPPNLG